MTGELLIYIYSVNWMHTAQGRFLCAPRICRIQAARGRSYERRVMENVIGCRTEKIQKDEITSGFYRLFWIYVICGVAGFFIESLWCWIDFGEFTSRTSDMFFPISWVWGLGGVLVQLFTVNNRWSHPAYIFLKCTVVGAGFEFLCGYLGRTSASGNILGLFGSAVSYRKIY